MKANDLITMAESLPIDIKIQLIDKLLNSLNIGLLCHIGFLARMGFYTLIEYELK